MILDIANYDDVQTMTKCMKDTGVCVILYYAHWCPACNSMLPEWGKYEKKMAKHKTQKNDLLNIFKIEDSNMSLISDSPSIPAVQSYPTIRKIKNNQVTEYDMPSRSCDNFITFSEVSNMMNTQRSKSGRAKSAKASKTKSAKAKAAKAKSAKAKAAKAKSAKASKAKAKAAKAKAAKAKAKSNKPK